MRYVEAGALLLPKLLALEIASWRLLLRRSGSGYTRVAGVEWGGCYSFPFPLFIGVLFAPAGYLEQEFV